MELQISAKVFGLGLQTHCTFLSNNLDLSSHTSIFWLAGVFCHVTCPPIVDQYSFYGSVWHQRFGLRPKLLCSYATMSFIKRQTRVICSFFFFLSSFLQRQFTTAFRYLLHTPQYHIVYIPQYQGA